MRTTRIRAFYQADPAGVVPGGIDTFIRGLVNWAPEDLEFSLVGMTTEPGKRPVGRWTRCSLGRRDFDFFAAFSEHNAGGRSRVPLTMRLCWHALRHRDEVMHGFDVLELHRIEPLIIFTQDHRPRNAFFHQDMAILHNKNADIRWRAVPAAYFWLEDRLIPYLDSGFCVREAGVESLRERYPTLAKKVSFVPTWADVEMFHPEVDPMRLADARVQFRAKLGHGPHEKLIVTVGRIDAQKQPGVLFDAFARIAQADPDVALVYVGDGVLREGLEARVRASGLGARVHFLGLLPQPEIASLLRVADLFALSSAYEGMPMALLEGLASGLPVVSMDVGEVRKVVSARCGEVVVQQSAEAFSAALARVLSRLDMLTGAPCLQAIENYTPGRVLGHVYENYRLLGARRIHSKRVHKR